MMQVIDVRHALPRHATLRWERRTQPITVFCIHHTATAATTTPEAIARFHVSERGWPGTSYHYLITADGSILWANDDNLFTWHGNDWNVGLGVCLIGDFTNAEPTEAQLAAARWLYAEKQREYGPLRLVGHSEAPRANTECPGRTWGQWRDRIVKEMTMSKLGVHFQKIPHWHRRVINEGSCEWVKFIDPTGPYPYSRPVKVIGRRWIGGDHIEQRLIDQGAAGADQYFEMLLPRYREAPWVTVWEGPNEPAPFWDRLHNLAAFTLRWMDRMQAAGLRCAVGNFSVGQPQIHDLRVVFGPVIDRAEFWALHEYSQPTMQTDQTWLCLRYRRFVAELREHNFRVPPLLITECGIDGGAVTPQRQHEERPRRGWKTFATWAEYQSQLSWYASEIAKDDYVLTATPFVSDAETHPDTGWLDFDLNEERTRWVAGVARPQPPQPTPPTVPQTDQRLGDLMQAHVVPFNPDAALARAAHARGIGLVAVSRETRIDDQMVQVFRTDQDRGKQYVFACRVGDWANVRGWERAD